MQNIVINAATTNDIPRMVALLSQLFALEQDFTPNPDAQERGLRLLLAQPEDRRCAFVARHSAHGVIGMITAQTVISTAMGAPSIWIEDVVVDAPFRHQGVGPELINAVHTWSEAQGVSRLQLLADADNTPALNFYRQQGWAPTRLYAWKKTLAAGA